MAILRTPPLEERINSIIAEAEAFVDARAAEVAKDNEQRLGPDDDARQIAGRLTFAAWQTARGDGDFNRPLRYSRPGIA